MGHPAAERMRRSQRKAQSCSTPGARAMPGSTGRLLGICAGVLDVEIGDLLLTALFVLASTMVLGGLRPAKPWRWTLRWRCSCLRSSWRLISFSRKALSGANLRVVPGISDGDCRGV